MQMKHLTAPLLGLILVIAGCTYEQLSPPVDCNVSTLTLSISGVVQDANCGQENGAFEVLATGGDGAYEYRLGGESSVSGVFTDLAAGTYTVEVSDQSPCSASIEVSVQNLDGLNITVASTDAGCQTSEGVISITATGGETPYSFRLDNGTSVSESTFSGLEAGAYEITAVDNSGCEINQAVTVLSGVSYSNTVSDIIAQECLRCHGAGGRSPNLSTLSGVQASASRVRTRTSAGTMPPDKTLLQSDIDAIACWVNDGAVNN